jgi:hypothetical protein
MATVKKLGLISSPHLRCCHHHRQHASSHPPPAWPAASSNTPQLPALTVVQTSLNIGLSQCSARAHLQVRLFEGCGHALARLPVGRGSRGSWQPVVPRRCFDMSVNLCNVGEEGSAGSPELQLGVGSLIFGRGHPAGSIYPLPALLFPALGSLPCWSVCCRHVSNVLRREEVSGAGHGEAASLQAQNSCLQETFHRVEIRAYLCQCILRTTSELLHSSYRAPYLSVMPLH